MIFIWISRRGRRRRRGDALDRFVRVAWSLVFIALSLLVAGGVLDLLGAAH